jgi:D-3-phosphoglycerate dehydrogenase / 2-oxoglutarate reductase
MGLLAVITDNRFGDSDIERSVLESEGIALVVAKCRSSSEVAAAGREADALLVNMAPADAAAIESLERCRVIARYGVGLDNVDLDAAKRKGIAVANVPGYCDREVAEHALGLLLACARAIPQRDGAIRGGLWNVPASGRRVSGSTLGVLGFGGIGRAFVRAALGLGFREILVWSPHISSERIDEAVGAGAAALGVTVRTALYDEVFASSDWVSINIPLKPETRGLVGARELGLMKRDATLINVSRGAIVDEEALVEALASGNLSGAGLDVYTAEPLPKGSGLRSVPGVVLTDHSAYASRESIAELRRRTAENALTVLKRCGLC